MSDTICTIIFAAVIGTVFWIWARDVWSAKRHLDIVGTRLSPERVEALFVDRIVRWRDAYDYSADGLIVQPPSRIWTMRLILFPEGHGCAGRLDLAACEFHPWPRRGPVTVTQVIRNGAGIASRKRAFKRALRREDPEIVFREARSVFELH